MAIRSHHRVEIRHVSLFACARHDARGKALDIDLVADSRPRRNDPDIFEGLLRPFQETIALPIARELHLHVFLERIRAARRIGNDRMVDNQIERNLRVDTRRVAPQIARRFAHDRQVDEHGHPREILQQDACRHIFDLAPLLARKACGNDPLSKNSSRFGIGCIAQYVLEQNAKREREAFCALR